MVGEERLEEVLRNLRVRMRDQIGIVKEDPFVILGVSPGDTAELITAVYRVKARYFHPDNQKTGNASAFKRLQSAYQAVLKATEPNAVER